MRNGAARKTLPEIPKLKGRSEWKGSPILSSKRLLLRVAEHSSFLWLVRKQTHLVLPRSRQVYQQVCTIWLFQAALALYVPHYRDCTEKAVQWQRNTVCAILILNSDFWGCRIQNANSYEACRVCVKQCNRGAWDNSATIRWTGVPASALALALKHIFQLKFRLRIQACCFLLARPLWS